MTKDEDGYKVNTITVKVAVEDDYIETASVIAAAVKDHLPVYTDDMEEMTSTAVQFEGTPFGLLFYARPHDCFTVMPAKYKAYRNKWETMGQKYVYVGVRVRIRHEMEIRDIFTLGTAVRRTHEFSLMRGHGC